MKHFLRTLTTAVTLVSAITATHGARCDRPVDFFARAIRTRSSAPYDVLVTIVNDRTGASRKVCLMSDMLVDAEILEMGLSRSDKHRAKAEAVLIANKQHVYHFRKAAALDCVTAAYTIAQLSWARQKLARYSNRELEQAFHGRGNSTIANSVEAGEDGPHMMAVAHVLMERGFQTYNTDMFFGVGIITMDDIRAEEAEDARTSGVGQAP